MTEENIAGALSEIKTQIEFIRREISVIHDRIDKRDSEIQNLQRSVTEMKSAQATLKWLLIAACTITTTAAAIIAIL